MSFYYKATHAFEAASLTSHNLKIGDSSKGFAV